jgi:hypothetical protein
MAANEPIPAVVILVPGARKAYAATRGVNGRHEPAGSSLRKQTQYRRIHCEEPAGFCTEPERGDLSHCSKVPTPARASDPNGFGFCLSKFSAASENQPPARPATQASPPLNWKRYPLPYQPSLTSARVSNNRSRCFLNCFNLSNIVRSTPRMCCASVVFRLIDLR